MEKKRIVWHNGTCLSVTIPVDGCNLTLEEIACRAVPSGVPYRILDVADIPADRTFRAAWECDFSNPDGYGGNTHG